ncbi:MAG: hypothetical protein KY476_07015 [Planctomycetes bacterium]|nr:hypothetical protein [Planctomycetota bacterium]
MTRLRPLLMLGLWLCTAARAADGGEVLLVVDRPLTAAASLALADLESALEARKIASTRRPSLDDSRSPRLVIGIAGSSPLVDGLLRSAIINLPEEPESLCIRQVEATGGSVLLIAGRDSVGLSYALLEAAAAIEKAPPAEDPLGHIPEVVERPFLKHRSVTIHPANADLEADWYYDEDFWRWYFGMLARCRFNNFTLAFADQTNYLNPVYAWLVDVPGFEDVKPRGLTAADRERNLRMLGRIAELARERGLSFTFGVWTQQPVEAYGGEVLVTRMPEGEAFTRYCAQGLQMVLQACPAITGVQFRMNAESGISEDEQTAYYQSQFDAIRNGGRDVKLDLRYKGLRESTIEQALATGLDVTVSTKFWCEHLGLPYHPTAEDRHYRENRYGYGAMLKHPRKHRVIYRLWTVGSQRLLLWADPEYAARFARSCRLGGGEGFEVFAPLTNKGYGNVPGKWRIFADRSYESYRWEQERYWFYYLAFGRMGFNPETGPDVWRRELRQRFGPAADAVEAAYRHGSQILPLITAARLPSASEWRWWPEMDTGGALREYIHTVPGDTAQFYGIRAWKRTPEWFREDWDGSIAGYVDDAVAGTLTARTTPLEVSRDLRRLAEQTLAAVERTRRSAGNLEEAELRATLLDMQVHAQLGLYHAEKLRAGTHVAFFELTGEAGRLGAALEHSRQAAAAWERIVELTDGVYHENLIFGHTAGSRRSRGGHHHSGHWKDRLPEIRREVASLESLLKEHPVRETTYRRFPGESPARDQIHITSEPVARAIARKDLHVTARVESTGPVGKILLHFRPLNQTVDWKQVEMTSDGAGRFTATIPGEEVVPQWDFMYYIEARSENGGRLWPSWRTEQPYVVVPVQREDAASTVQPLSGLSEGRSGRNGVVGRRVERSAGVSGVALNLTWFWRRSYFVATPW